MLFDIRVIVISTLVRFCFCGMILMALVKTRSKSKSTNGRAILLVSFFQPFLEGLSVLVLWRWPFLIPRLSPSFSPVERGYSVMSLDLDMDLIFTNAQLFINALWPIVALAAGVSFAIYLSRLIISVFKGGIG